MCDVDDEMGRAEIAMAGYSVSCSVKPARDGVNPVMREGGGVRKLLCATTIVNFVVASPSMNSRLFSRRECTVLGGKEKKEKKGKKSKRKPRTANRARGPAGARAPRGSAPGRQEGARRVPGNENRGDLG